MSETKPSRILKVGITGSLSSGKSEVRRVFEQKGCLAIDADEIAREVTGPGSETLRQIAAIWGNDVLSSDGSLNRRSLAGKVFVSKDDVRRLNGILHPLIINRENEIMEDAVRSGYHGIIVVEAALMMETGSYERFEHVILVTCAEDTAIQRAVKGKGMDEKLFYMIKAFQLPDEEKRKMADFVLKNDDSLKQLKETAETVYDKLREMLESKR